MKYLAIVILLLAATLSFGQCSADPVQGTNCAGPIKTTVKPGQSPTSFTDFYPATVQWPCLKAPDGFFRLCATGGHVAVDLGDGQGYLNLRGRDGKDGLDGKDGAPGANGLNGAQGPQGVQGLQGTQGDRGPQGLTGVVVGTVQTVNVACPKGKGTVPGGFVSLGCTVTTTAVH